MLPLDRMFFYMVPNPRSRPHGQFIYLDLIHYIVLTLLHMVCTRSRFNVHSKGCLSQGRSSHRPSASSTSTRGRQKPNLIALVPHLHAPRQRQRDDALPVPPGRRRHGRRLWHAAVATCQLGPSSTTARTFACSGAAHPRTASSLGMGSRAMLVLSGASGWRMAKTSPAGTNPRTMTPWTWATASSSSSTAAPCSPASPSSTRSSRSRAS